MTTMHRSVSQVATVDVVRQPTIWSQAGQFVGSNLLGVAGALVVLIMILMAIFASALTSYDPTANDFSAMLEAPSIEHLLGTDQYGRDLLARIMFGARTALLVGFVSAFVGATAGLVLGVASAYFGGLVDLVFQRVMDVLMAFPLIILALAVVSVGKALPIPDAFKVILAITIPFIPRCARVVRSSALAIREMPYIDAARANGFSHTRIILRHMLPNVMAPYLIIFTASVGQAILIEASLSYLGLGVQEPTPAWGLMLRGGAEEYVESAPWVAIFPGIGITLAVFGFNLFGDSVRDALDPKLRST